MDIVPTFCDFAGITPSAESRRIALRPSCNGQAQPRPHVTPVGLALNGHAPARQNGRVPCPLEPGLRRQCTSHLRFDSAAREGRMLRTEIYKFIAFNRGSGRSSCLIC